MNVTSFQGDLTGVSAKKSSLHTRHLVSTWTTAYVIVDVSHCLVQLPQNCLLLPSLFSVPFAYMFAYLTRFLHWPSTTLRNMVLKNYAQSFRDVLILSKQFLGNDIHKQFQVWDDSVHATKKHWLLSKCKHSAAVIFFSKFYIVFFGDALIQKISIEDIEKHVFFGVNWLM